MNTADPLEPALRLLRSIEGPINARSLDASGWKTVRKAEILLRESAERPETRGRALVELGSLCRRTGRVEEALIQFDLALSLPAEAVGWLAAVLRKAELHVQLAQGQAAIGLLRRGLERHPGDADLQVLLGSCLYYRGEMEAARSALEGALRVRPEHAGARALLTAIVRRIGGATSKDPSP